MKALGSIVLGFVIVGASLTASGCGSGGSSSSAAGGSSAEAGAESNPDQPGPTLVVPDGPPPKKLVVKDLKNGTGRVAKGGDEVTVRYSGIYWNGEAHSNSWAYPEAPTFELGDGQLSRPLDLGIRGMQEGGRRELIAPANLVFYPDVPHEELGPEYAQIFQVELFKVR